MRVHWERRTGEVPSMDRLQIGRPFAGRALGSIAASFALVVVLGFGMPLVAAPAAASAAYTLTDLGTLPGGLTSYALAINASGQVVGTGSTATEDQHAFLWWNGKITDL